MNSEKSLNKIKRGFIDKTIDLSNYNTDIESLKRLISSDNPSERTIGVRIIGNQNQDKFIPMLCNALKEENKLYSKLEICDSLVSYKEKSLPFLIDLLGLIGNNQHKKVPESEFKKSNYPLPRDIAARCISRIGICALPYLMPFIKTTDAVKTYEAIDAIGYICFYNKNNFDYRLFQKLYEMSINDDLIKWKIVRALESFKGSERFLNECLENESNKRISSEIKRSLTQIKMRS